MLTIRSINRRSLIVGSLAMVVMLGVQTASSAILFDDFDGAANASPDSEIWTTYRYSYPGTTVLDGASNVSVKNSGGYGHYAGMVTNAADFDAFETPLTIELDATAFGGTPGSGSNNSWVVYGRSNDSSLASASQYRVSTSQMAYGLAVSIRYSSAGYRLSVLEFSDAAGGGKATDEIFDLLGAPTGLTVAIDGASQSVDVTLAGTTFTSTGLSSLTQALSTDFTAANLSVDGTLTARIAMGVDNGGNVDAGTTFGADSITVVPEPTTLALMTAGLLFSVRRRRR